MTPDEVVEELKKMLDEPKFSFLKSQQALNSALTLLQDYQKLRERVSVEKIAKLIESENIKEFNQIGIYLLPKQEAMLICDYLQQPTEH